MADFPNFEMDHHGIVLRNLVKSTPDFCEKIFTDCSTSPNSRFIDFSAALLVPNTESLRDQFLLKAFIVGSGTVTAAFAESDQSSVWINTVMNKFYNQDLPIELIKEDDGKTREAFEEVAKKGKVNHQEIKRHLDYVSDYFADTTQAGDIATVAYLGGYFTAAKLDEAQERAVYQGLTELAGHDFATIDWEELQRLAKKE